MNPQFDHEPWHTHHFRAMGSQISIWLELDTEDLAQTALRQAEQMFIAAERRLTRFTSDSELSRLNAQPERWTCVSNLTWDVINHALSLAQETQGLYDPTLLNALEVAGYDRSFEQLALTNLTRAGHPQLYLGGRWSEIRLAPKQHALRLPAGLRLDLGGIGKGYTAQQVVNFLSQWGPCLVDAGGDLTAGDAPSGWPGWAVGVAEPWSDPDQTRGQLFQLWLANATLATSGIDYRRWQKNGQIAHHLIDPRTGQPAITDVLTVTVLSTEATQAEAWATAALIAGMTIGHAYLTTHQLAGALVDQAGNLSLTSTMQSQAIKAK